MSVMQESTQVGAWTTYSCDISEEANKIFSKTPLPLGVKYTPVAVATQLVSGKNYSFFCNAQITTPNPPNEAAIVDIYQPLEGDPKLVEIRSIEHKQ